MSEIKQDNQISYTFVIECENDKYYIGIYNVATMVQGSKN